MGTGTPDDHTHDDDQGTGDGGRVRCTGRGCMQDQELQGQGHVSKHPQVRRLQAMNTGDAKHVHVHTHGCSHNDHDNGLEGKVTGIAGTHGALQHGAMVARGVGEVHVRPHAHGPPGGPNDQDATRRRHGPHQPIRPHTDHARKRRVRHPCARHEIRRVGDTLQQHGLGISHVVMREEGAYKDDISGEACEGIVKGPRGCTMRQTFHHVYNHGRRVDTQHVFQRRESPDTGHMDGRPKRHGNHGRHQGHGHGLCRQEASTSRDADHHGSIAWM